MEVRKTNLMYAEETKAFKDKNNHLEFLITEKNKTIDRIQKSVDQIENYFNKEK